MERTEGLAAMITGANVGIGKEVARQLAQSGKYRQIYLACRNLAKADLAKKDLETVTGKAIFEVVVMNVSDPISVRAAISSLAQPIDDLVMNAGGSGGKTPLSKTKDGVTEIFASNVLGHVVLLDELIKTNKLKRAAILVGSEAARGVPKFGMKRPKLSTSSVDEFASLCDGTYFSDRKADATLAYGQVKYVGAMWMASTARRNSNLRLLTVSPGNTRGTDGLRDLPAPLRIFARYVAMPVIMPLFGLVHDVEDGARRLVEALTDPSLKSGHFYASQGTKLTGRVIDQSEIFSDLANEAYQDNASEAVHRFAV